MANKLNTDNVSPKLEDVQKVLPPILKNLTIFIGVVTSFFHLYTGGIRLIYLQNQRGIHLLIMLVLCFLLYPINKKKKSMAWLDWLLILGSIASSLYMLFSWEERIMRLSSPGLPEIIMGVIVLICVLEAARRAIGLALPITALLFISYALFGNNLPGILEHKPYSFSRLVSFLYMTTEGVYGMALGISATFVALFIIFGAFLNESGGGKYFIDFAYALTGRTRGGPAKTAVVSSALVGSISGSPIANVVTTGTFTIPLMKKTGYPNYIAGAIEAVASTGGMLMPPVMGAVAFIMAEYLGISYFEVMKAAILPAILYYACIFFIVDLKAAKLKLGVSSSFEIPALKETISNGGHLFIPIVILVIFMVIGWSAMKAVFWSTIILFIIAMLRKTTRFDLKKVVAALYDGAKSLIPVAIACACSGIIVGIVAMTGLGVRFSSSLLALSQGSLFFVLFFSMIASLILGMGLPAVPVYLITTSLNASVIISLGVPPIATHLFLFYFGIISTITPPVALTSYAASGVAQSNPNKTGFAAFKLGLVAYVVPYLFVYTPVLLMIGSTQEIILAVITSLFGIFLLAVGIEGYLFKTVRIFQRILFFASGVFLVMGGIDTDIIGGVIGIVLIWINYAKQEK